MTNKELIDQLKLLKSLIEWDLPMDYQVVIDEVIKTIHGCPKVPDITHMKTLGYDRDYSNEYIRKNVLCPQCNTNHLIVMTKTDGGRKMAIEFCGNCGFRSDFLKKKTNLKKRNNQHEEWRRVVIRNYDGKCAICGSEDGVEAHHIFPIYKFKEYQYTLGNGIALCKNCHAKIHEYEFDKKRLVEKIKEDKDNGGN